MNERLLGEYSCLFPINLRLISQSQIMKCPLLMHTGWHKSYFTLQATNIKCQITFSLVCVCVCVCVYIYIKQQKQFINTYMYTS